MSVKQISLEYCQGKSNKVYQVQLEKQDNGYVVNFQFGRKGSSLKDGTKTATPVDKEKAEKVYDKLVKEKMKKGYIPSDETIEYDSAQYTKEIEEVPQLLNEVSEEVLLQLLEDDNFVAQEKQDGERRLVKKNNSTTFGINKKGVKVALPKKIASNVKKIPTLTVDGEEVGEHLFVFDCLNYNGQDLKELPYLERLKIMDSLSFEGKNISVVYTAYTTKEKKALYEKLKEENKEGIVFKRKDSSYQAGRPNSGGVALKYKFYKTTTAKVSSHTEGKRSVALEMIENSQVVPVGKVTIPANKKIPKVGTFVEVRYLYAYEGGSLYQPVYLGERNDQDDTDIETTQLVYKN